MFSLFESENRQLNKCQKINCLFGAFQIILILASKKYMYNIDDFIILLPPFLTIVFYNNAAVVINAVGALALGFLFKKVMYEGIEASGTYGWVIIIGFFLCVYSVYSICKDDRVDQ